MSDKKARELERQLKRDPTNVGLRLQLAALYRSLGREDDALGQYREIARGYRGEGRPQQALAVARSALEMAPDDTELRRLADELAREVERPGIRILSQPIPVREIEPVSSGTVTKTPSPRRPIIPEPGSGPTPARPTPYTPTPLPPPLAYHEADPSHVRHLDSLEPPVTEDTMPESTHAELGADARRISEKMAVPTPVLEGEDLASELETRRRPKIEPDVLAKLAKPPTIQIPKVEEVEAEIGGHEEEPTSPSGEVPWVEPDPPTEQEGSAASSSFEIVVEEVVPEALASLPDAASQALLAGATRRTLPAGTAIVRDGEPGDSLFIVEAGEARVLKRVPPRPVTEMARIGAGDLVGEIAIRTDRKRHATIQAVTEVRVVEIAHATVLRVAEQYPALTDLLDRLTRQRLVANLLLLSPFFTALPPVQRPVVFGRFKPRKVRAGTEVIEQGEAARGLFMVLLGALELVVTRPDGRRVSLGKVGEGAHVGELALLDDEPEAATATALGAAELVVLPAADFYQIVKDQPKLWSALKAGADQRKLQITAALG